MRRPSSPRKQLRSGLSCCLVGLPAPLARETPSLTCMGQLSGSEVPPSREALAVNLTSTRWRLGHSAGGYGRHPIPPPNPPHLPLHRAHSYSVMASHTRTALQAGGTGGRKGKGGRETHCRTYRGRSPTGAQSLPRQPSGPIAAPPSPPAPLTPCAPPCPSPPSAGAAGRSPGATAAAAAGRRAGPARRAGH